ncbi:MAG: hypothetical protein HY430_00055 [Candidatus Levybacteria bacterium]|nr:hypothetical protein [Candidatus Levybacteria bacterium]
MARKQFYHKKEHRSRFYLFFLMAVAVVASLAAFGYIKSVQESNVLPAMSYNTTTDSIPQDADIFSDFGSFYAEDSVDELNFPGI